MARRDVVVNVAQTTNGRLRAADRRASRRWSPSPAMLPADRRHLIVGRPAASMWNACRDCRSTAASSRIWPRRFPASASAFHSIPTKGSNYAPSINGGAGRNINYQIDGGDNNDDTIGGLLQQFPLEAIQEFHFETQRFKAEYGRSNGGVMNVVTKSGTNQYQGTLFELFRDKAMNAADGNRNARGEVRRRRSEEGRLPPQSVRRQLRRAVDAGPGPFLSGDRAHAAGHDANGQHARGCSRPSTACIPRRIAKTSAP